LDQKQFKWIRQTVSQLLDELRPDVISLSDAFDVPDRILNRFVGAVFVPVSVLS
jgi:hypothetical protein